MTEEEFQKYLDRVVGGCCRMYSRQSPADRLYTQLVVINALHELKSTSVGLPNSFHQIVAKFQKLPAAQNGAGSEKWRET